MSLAVGKGMWSAGVEQIMARPGQNFRDRQKKLVGEAYSNIKISDMALILAWGRQRMEPWLRGARGQWGGDS